MRKAYKNIISLSVVLIAGLNFIVTAFAQDPFSGIAIGGIGGASGAGLFGSMAGMSGINISYTSDPVNDAMWNKLNSDSVYFSGEKHEASGTGEDVWDYITVNIEDWLSAQSDFIVDFAQRYNVQDNDSGNVSTPSNIDGIPYEQFDLSGYATSSLGLFGPGTFVAGSYRLDITQSGLYYNCVSYYNGVQIESITRNSSMLNREVRLYGSDIRPTKWIFSVAQGTTFTDGPGSGRGDITPSTNIPWTSETVNTNVFDGWEAAKVKIPHSISQLQSGWTVEDFLNELNRIWRGAGEDNILIEDTGSEPPVPPVPIPDTPLGNVPFDDWVDLWGQGIWQQLENQSDALDFIGSNGEDQIEELESIDSNLDDLNGTAESIDTNIGTGIGLLGGIKSAAESAVEFLEGIAEHVEELVEEIVVGTETLIAGILNQIPHVFGVIFGPIKQASSIWHYVVEWIQSISAPMSWMWSMASGTSYNIILPVYASLAGAVVLAFYKRFGK